MVKFKYKSGGLCEVFSKDNIDKLRKDKNYTELVKDVNKTIEESNNIPQKPQEK